MLVRLIHAIACLVVLGLSSGALTQEFTETFDVPGTFGYTVPEGVTELEVEVAGGNGGGGSGGSASSSAFVLFGSVIRETTATGAAGGDGALGQLITQTIAVSPGEVLTIVVGDGGRGGQLSNGEFPPEPTLGGAGGAGDPAGDSGSNASGGYADMGLISGGGGGAGGGSSVTGPAGSVQALGGAGGGGGGGAYGLDTETGQLIFEGTLGQPASAGAAGGACSGYVNPLFMSADIAPDELNQVCEVHPDGSLYQPDTPEHGGAGASGYTGRGDAAGTGGGGAPTVTGGEEQNVPGLAVPIYVRHSDGEAGEDGALGYVRLSGTVVLSESEPPTSPEARPVPAVPVPLLLLGALAVGCLGARRAFGATSGQ